MLEKSNNRIDGYTISFLLQKFLGYFTGEQGLTQVLKTKVTLIDIQNTSRKLELTKINELESNVKIKSFIDNRRNYEFAIGLNSLRAYQD